MWLRAAAAAPTCSYGVGRFPLSRFPSCGWPTSGRLPISHVCGCAAGSRRAAMTRPRATAAPSCGWPTLRKRTSSSSCCWQICGGCERSLTSSDLSFLLRSRPRPCAGALQCPQSLQELVAVVCFAKLRWSLQCCSALIAGLRLAYSSLDASQPFLLHTQPCRDRTEKRHTS